MNYIEAPDYEGHQGPSLFLAGGITGCEDWQSYIISKISFMDITIFNPRRADFPIYDPTAAQNQIKWEYDHLRKASMISFWFCRQTICPIVLYELGAWSMTDKTLVVGMDPTYKRRQDVEIQTKLVRPDINIVYSLDDLSSMIIEEYKNLYG